MVLLNYNKNITIKNQTTLKIKIELWEMITVFSQIPFSKNLYRMETSQLICKSNQVTCFYMMSLYWKASQNRL